MGRARANVWYTDKSGLKGAAREGCLLLVPAVSNFLPWPAGQNNALKQTKRYQTEASLASLAVTSFQWTKLRFKVAM